MSRNRNRKTSGTVGGQGANSGLAISGNTGGQFIPLWGGQQGNSGGGGNQPKQLFLLDINVDEIMQMRGVNPFAVAGIHCFSPSTGIETLAYTPGVMQGQQQQKTQTKAAAGRSNQAPQPNSQEWLIQQVATLSRSQKQLTKQLNRLNQPGHVTVSTGKQRKGTYQATMAGAPYAGATAPQLVRV